MQPENKANNKSSRLQPVYAVEICVALLCMCDLAKAAELPHYA